MVRGVPETGTLESVFEVPGYTFFYWGFTLPKRRYTDLIRYFGLSETKKRAPIKLVISNKEFDAKIELVRISSPKYPNRDVVRIYYDRELATLKALRKFFMYSYASTINRSKSELKELMELVHLGGNRFRVKPVARHKTDFDAMFNFLEDKNLFDYWKDARKGGTQPSFFIDVAKRWLEVKELEQYNDRINVIYLLYHSRNRQLYVGKANRLGDRVKAGMGRIGLDDDWDRFMFFEINPDYNAFVEQIEAFVIRSFAALMQNEVGVPPLNAEKFRLVNRQLVEKN